VTTKVIAGLHVSLDPPNHRDILATLRNCIRTDPELGPACGRPLAVMMDRGTTNTADAVTAALAALAIPALLTDGYSPNQNGSIESFHALVESDYAPCQPLYAHPPIQLDGRSYLPDPSVALSRDQFQEKLRTWVANYNQTHLHSDLGGRTPNQAWEEAETQPDPVPDELLRFFHLNFKRGSVQRRGVRIDNEFYIAPEVDPRLHAPVDVGFGDDIRSVEIFDPETGAWLCTAINQKFLSPEQQLAVKEPARKRKKKTRSTHAAALKIREEQAAATKAESARPSPQEREMNDDLAAALNRARRPSGAINQPVADPDASPSRPTRRRPR
jgi:hypothetical protein